MSGCTTKIHEAETFYLNFKLLFQITHKYLTSSEKPTNQGDKASNDKVSETSGRRSCRGQNDPESGKTDD